MTAEINGVVVKGTVDEIYNLLQKVNKSSKTLDNPDDSSKYTKLSPITKPYNPLEHDIGIEYWYNQPTCTGDSPTVSYSSTSSTDKLYDMEKEEEWFSNIK